MKKLLFISFFLILLNSPSYSLDIICKLTRFTCSKVNYENLIKRNGFHYEKFKNEKYLGYVFGVKSGFVKNGKREGTWEIYFKSGELRSKTNFKNGIREGVFEEYYKNGSLKNKKSFINGKINGIYNNYYKNGQLWFWTEYKDGKRNGDYEKFKNDTLIVKGNYKDDKKEGLWSYTDKLGKVTTQVWSSGMLKSGFFTHRNGTKGMVKNFKREGYWKEYQKLGISEGNYENDERVGFWKVIDSLDVYSKGKFINGYKDGNWERYWRSGKLLSKENYKNNKLDGKRFTYYRNGKIKSIVNYKNGSEEGDYEIFLDSGVTCERGTYNNNLKKIEFKLYKSKCVYY